MNTLAAHLPAPDTRDVLASCTPVRKASEKQSSGERRGVKQRRDAVPVLGSSQHGLVGSYELRNGKIWRGDGSGQTPRPAPDDEGIIK